MTSFPKPNQSKYKLLSEVIRNVFRSQYWFPVPVSFLALCSSTQSSVTFKTFKTQQKCHFYRSVRSDIIYLHAMFAQTHEVGVRAGPHASGNCPGFENKRATPSRKPVKVVRSDLGVNTS